MAPPDLTAALSEFQTYARRWIEENRPAPPAFRLPHSALEVMTEEQRDYLQAWQLKCYEARLIGSDYPVEYGGWGMEGPHRPPNALFIYASGDPEGLRRASDHLAATLAQSVEGEGDLATGTGVKVVEVPGRDHLTILYSEDAAREIVAWLDATFELERLTPLELDDPRLAAAALALLAFLALAAGLGGAAGRLAPAWSEEPLEGPLQAFLMLVLSLVAALPFGASESLAGVLAQEVTPEVVSFFLAAGLLLLGWLALRGRLGSARLAARAPRSLAVAGGVLLALMLVQTPLGVVFHRLVLTPERAFIAVLGGLGTLPLFLALELLLRRGTTARASASAIAGKILILIVMLAGVLAGLLPEILLIMLPVLAPALLLMELVAVPLYAGSRNRLVIALVEAGWLGWIQAAVMPTSW